MSRERFKRPAHPDLEYPEANLAGLAFIDTQIFERLHDIQIGFTRGDDAEPGVAAVEHNSIQSVNPGKLARSINFELIEATFLFKGCVWPTGMNSLFWQHEVLGDNDIDSIRIDFSRDCGVHVLGDRLQRDPGTAVT